MSLIRLLITVFALFALNAIADCPKNIGEWTLWRNNAASELARVVSKREPIEPYRGKKLDEFFNCSEKKSQKKFFDNPQFNSCMKNIVQYMALQTITDSPYNLDLRARKMFEYPATDDLLFDPPVEIFHDKFRKRLNESKLDLDPYIEKTLRDISSKDPSWKIISGITNKLNKRVYILQKRVGDLKYFVHMHGVKNPDLEDNIILMTIDARKKTISDYGNAQAYFKPLSQRDPGEKHKWKVTELRHRDFGIQAGRCISCHKFSGLLDLDTIDNKYISLTKGVSNDEIFDLFFPNSKKERKFRSISYFKIRDMEEIPSLGDHSRYYPDHVEKCLGDLKSKKKVIFTTDLSPVIFDADLKLTSAQKEKIAKSMNCIRCHTGEDYQVPRLAPPFGPSHGPTDPVSASLDSSLMPPPKYHSDKIPLTAYESQILKHCLFSEYFKGFESVSFLDSDTEKGPFYKFLLGKPCSIDADESYPQVDKSHKVKTKVTLLITVKI